MRQLLLTSLIGLSGCHCAYTGDLQGPCINITPIIGYSGVGFRINSDPSYWSCDNNPDSINSPLSHYEVEVDGVPTTYEGLITRKTNIYRRETGLSLGDHTVTIKAWDRAGNVTIESLDVSVEKNKRFPRTTTRK